MERFLTGRYCIRVFDSVELDQILNLLARNDLLWISGYPADIPPFPESYDMSFPITIFYRPSIRRLVYNSLGSGEGMSVLNILDFPEIIKPVPLDLSFLTE